MQNVSVPFVLYELTESPAWVGLASFAQFIPAVVVGPLGGSLADRYPRRTVVIIAQSVMSIIAVSLWALWASGNAQAWSIIVLVALLGTASGISIASWQALVAELVPRKLLLNAVTLNSAQFNGARAFGPALGGLVLAGLGPSGAFALNAVSFVAVLVALFSLAHRPAVAVRGAGSSVRSETVDTARYIRSTPGIWTCVRIVAAVGFLGSPVFPFLVVFAEEVFSVEGIWYGLLGAGLGLGGVVGTPFIAGRGSGIRRSSLARGALALYAAALVAFALSPVYAVGLVMLVVAGGAYLAITSTLNTTIQLQVSEARRGKVLALYLMGLTSSYPLGSLLQGAVADRIGVRAVTAGAGALLLVTWARFASTGRFAALDDEVASARGPRPASD